ncbi:hypothetical protein CSC62_03675 [Pseudoxanthomonas jiangsuensis]|nr:hypothetical protein CSC62_03675 [Pseudoxanthomonas jiangsuensis]
MRYRAGTGHAKEGRMGKDRGAGVARAGIGFGSALAIAISWTANKSLLWAIVHGILGWLYVGYYALVYHFR